MKVIYQSSLVLIISLVGVFSCQNSQITNEPNDDDFVCEFPTPGESYPIVEIETDLGTMYFWLFDETPKHKAKFIELANADYYNDFTFNRVIADFVIQGGCPDSPEYFEGSPYLLEPEFVDTLGHVYGALGMGRDDNPGKQSNACQFYIVNNKDGVHRLDGDYMIFGEIIHGEDVLDKISQVTTDSTDTPMETIPLNVQIKEYYSTQLERLFDFSPY